MIAPAPSVVAPSLNVTDPVADSGTTVAVSVIGTPKSDGELVELTVTAAVIPVTVNDWSTGVAAA